MKHFSSFTVSLLTHLGILALVFVVYKTYKHTINAKEASKEKFICIKAQQIVSSTKEIKQKKTFKKEEVKAKKAHSTKQKKEIKKTPKKIIKKTPRKKLQKKVENKQVESHTESIKQEEKLQKTQASKITKTKPPQKQFRPKAPLPSPITTPVVKKNYTKEYLDKNIAKIRALIQENIYYPRKARKRHIEGTVILRFQITIEGIIKDITVISSDHDVLTNAAKQVLILIEDQVPKPKENITITLPISYKLR